MKLPGSSNKKPESKPEKSKYLTLGQIMTSDKFKNKDGSPKSYFKSNVYCGKSSVTGEALLGKLYVALPQEDGEFKFMELEQASIMEPLPAVKQKAPFVLYNLTVSLDKLKEVKE